MAGADDVIALKVAGMLANGMGGTDWSGLPIAAAYFGVRDVVGLIWRLRVIRSHDPKRNDEQG